MPSEIQYITYKDFIASLLTTENPDDNDLLVVSNDTDGPRAVTADTFALASDIDIDPTNPNVLAAIVLKLGYVSLFVAESYSDESSYLKGNVVWHNGAVYCAKSNTSGAWDATKWDSINIAKIISMLGSLKDGGSLTDAAAVTVPNNALSTLTTAQSTLTLRVYCEPGEIPNFAVEITTTASVTLTVVEIVSGGGASVATVLKYSAAGGNELESGKTYQVTCVGSCWTVAEFVDPNAQRNVTPQVQSDSSESSDDSDSPSVGDDDGEDR
jgi:hypothetical protein